MVYRNIFLSIFSFFIGEATHAQVNFSITVRLVGTDIQTVSLRIPVSSGQENIALIGKNDAFYLENSIPQETILTHVDVNGRFFKSLMISQGDSIVMEGGYSNPKEVTITGSKEQAPWTEWWERWEKMQQVYMLSSQISGSKAGSKIFNELIHASIDTILKRYPESPVAAMIIIQRYIDYPDNERAIASYAKLGEQAKQTAYGKTLTKSIVGLKRTMEGAVPVINLLNQNGKMVDVRSLRDRYVLVDFWASWCGPCRAENPFLKKVYEKYKSKGFEILGVSIDHNKLLWKKAIAEDQLPWIHVSDGKGWKSPLIDQFGIGAIPMNFLLDKTGKIIARNLRGEQVEIVLAGLLDI